MRKNNLQELKMMKNPNINKYYLHWTAGHYSQFFNDYHILIDYDGSIYASTNDLTELKYHTWRRNTNAVGIAMCCCYGALAHSGYNTDFGAEPPTQAQIETMAKVVSVLCDDVNSDTVMTHCEAALLDDYGPFSGDPETRWDLWYLKDYDGQMKPGGDVIRGKAIWYQQN